MENNNSSSKTATPATARTGFLRTEVSISDLLAIARRRWGWIVGSMVLGMAAGAAYALLTPPTYESEAQVLVMRKDPRLATTRNQPTNDNESKVSEDLLATHMQLVQSRRMVDEALTQNQLDQLPSITDQLSENLTAKEYVIKNLFVTRGGVAQAKNAHVLNIAFRHKSDVDCQRVLTAIVDRYQQFLAEKFQDVNSEAADLIAKAQVDLAKELENSESEYRVFREKSPLFFNGDQSTNVHRQEYDHIQAEISDLRLKSTESASRLELVELLLEEMEARGASALERMALIDEKNAERLGILISVDQGKAQTAQFMASMPDRTAGATAEFTELLKLMVAERTLLQDYGPNHPQVMTVREQIKQMRDFLSIKSKALGVVEDDTILDPKEVVNTYVKILRYDLTADERKMQQLETLAAKAEEDAKGLVSDELEGERLRKAVARQQELYDAVVDRLREINLAKDYGGFINEVIAPVELGQKIWPSLPVVMALGMVVGLVLGCGGAAIGETTDRSFRNAEEIHHSLGLPILTHLPNLVTPKKGVAAAAANGSSLDSTLRTFYFPKSREAEVFRGLRTNLFFSGDGKRLQVIECTSPNQGDGKSTLAANLAVSIAQTGRKVLIVDCDMRRPRLHDMFALTNTAGLADIIGGELEPWDVIQSTEVENLSALPCGQVPDNPAELLTVPAFENFLALARDRFDYIILDCPPVLAVADPCIVAPRADGVVLAVRISKDSRPQTLRAKQLLAEVGAPVLGVVVNCCDTGTHYGRYGYGDNSSSGMGYGYGYGYGNHDDNSNKYYEEADVTERRSQKPARASN